MRVLSGCLEHMSCSNNNPHSCCCTCPLLRCRTSQDGRIDYEEFCAMMRQGNEDVLKASTTLKTGILGVKKPRVTNLSATNLGASTT